MQAEYVLEKLLPHASNKAFYLLKIYFLIIVILIRFFAKHSYLWTGNQSLLSSLKGKLPELLSPSKLLFAKWLRRQTFKGT